MLDLNKMSAGDAQHNLNVLAWLFAHQEELQTIVCHQDKPALSMSSIVAAGGFNDWRRTQDEQNMLSVLSTRFVPVTVHMFSDDISTADVPDPMVALQIHANIVYPTHDDDSDPIAICQTYGIDPDVAAWTSIDPHADFNG